MKFRIKELKLKTHKTCNFDPEGELESIDLAHYHTLIKNVIFKFATSLLLIPLKYLLRVELRDALKQVSAYLEVQQKNCLSNYASTYLNTHPQRQRLSVIIKKYQSFSLSILSEIYLRSN